MSRPFSIRLMLAWFLALCTAILPAFVDTGQGISLGGKPSKGQISDVSGAGFQLVRMPFEVEPDLELVRHAVSKGLKVVVDFHPQFSWYSDPVTIFGLPEKWAQWARLLEEFSAEQVAIELLNEPRMARRGSIYDSVMKSCIEAVREVSPARWIVVSNRQLSDADWFAGPLGEWSPPRYDRLIVPMHYYRPYEITHPNSYRRPLLKLADTPVGGGSRFDLADWENRELHFQRYVNWCREHKVVAWIGEAGCYETVPNRAQWFTEVARIARELSVTVCWWGWEDRFGYRRAQRDADAILRIMLRRP